MVLDRNPRLLRILLVCTATCATIAAASVVHLVLKNRQLTEMQGRLAAEEWLQQELVAMTASDHAVLPHVVPEVGPVLNPAKRRATWRAAAGAEYQINALGLRGPEIRESREGVVRVLLVGDSVVFGWRIADQDRIGETIARVVNGHMGEEGIEVISVAVPSWNTSSAVEFTKRHLNRLQPDFIVWNLLRNDIQDVPAAVPPGVLGSWASPQKVGLETFAVGSDFQYELPTPSIVGRWRRNLDLIADFTINREVPGLLLSWMPDTRAHIEDLLRATGFPLPVVHLPGYYRNHDRWPVDAADPHPTPWATHAIAIGLIDAMLELEVIPQITFSDEEYEIADRWRSEAARSFTSEESVALYGARISRLPMRLDPADEATSAAVVYGIDGGLMSANGMFCLRSAGDAKKLVLEISIPESFAPGPRALNVAVRSFSGQETRMAVAVSDGMSSHEIELPACDGPSRGWEVVWEFDFADCSGPRDCVSATLIGARLSSL